MKAVILAGGMGTRLYPLTYTRPKTLIPLLNRPMARYTLDYFAGRSDEVVFAACHMIDELRSFLETVETDAKVDIAVEETPLGTGGAVKNVEGMLDEPFLVLNGDIISSFRVDDFISFAEKKGGMGSIALFPSGHPEDYGVVELDDDQRIIRFVEKPAPDQVFSNLVNAGMYYLQPEILDRIERGKKISMEAEVFPLLLDEGLFGYTFEGYWTDVGKFSTYLEANRTLLQEEGSRFEDGSDLNEEVQIVHPICIGPRLSASSGILGPNVSIGKDCAIGSARIDNSVLLDKVKVGEDVTISNSVLGEDVQIEDGCRLQDCVVADSERILEGSVLTNEKVGMR
ncbi:MAG: NDP-sugar synthase [Methanomassiliicoccales archaeon]|nr:MAG: NDP-sugar synthase [Methanomassiliicoccales archaeon]